MSRREKREQEEREEKERKQKEKQTKKKTSSKKKTQTKNSKEQKSKNKKEEKFEEIEITTEKKETKKEKTKKEKNKKPKEEKERKHKKEKKQSNIAWRILKTILKVLLIIILVIVIFAGIVVGWLGFKYDWNVNNMIKGGAKEVALLVTGQTEEDLANLEPLYCLVLGVSTDENLLLTDTIILVAYYPRTQQASMLSIPRDTFVGKSESRAGGYDKINALYQAGGGGDAGAQKTLSAIEDLTGIEIDNYLVVQNDGLIEIIDAIGGVDFNVPIKMDYDDPGQDLAIHLEAGYQHIDGTKAEQLLRFRHNNDGTSYPSSYGDNDIGRMRTQREFITETIKQTIQFKNVTKINELIEIAFRNIETNLDKDYVMKYAPAVIDFDISSLQTAYLPGASAVLGPENLWFYKAYKQDTQDMIEEFFTFKQAESDAKLEGTVLEPQYISLQLLNATGNEESFEKVVDTLEEKGYKIADTSETTYTKTTRIINRSNQEDEVINELKQTIGTGTESIGKTNSTYDITLIVGEDITDAINQIALQN